MKRNFSRTLSLTLVLTDIVLINLAFALAYWIRYELQWIRAVDEANYVPYREYLPISLLLTVILLIAYKMEGVYDQVRGRSWFDEVYSILNGTTTGVLLLVVFFFFYRPYFYSRLIFAYVVVLIAGLLAFSRLVKHIVLAALRRRGIGVVRILIVGAGEVGRAIMRNIVARPELGYQAVGFVDDDPKKGSTDIGRFKALGSLDNIPHLIRNLNVDEVIITLPWMYHRKIASIIAQCAREKVKVRVVPDLFQMSLSKVDIEELGGIPLLGVREIAIAGWKKTLKRAMDLVIASLMLVLLFPLMLIIAVAIKLDSPGPILFRQVRVGKDGRKFVLYKFRSMKEGAEEEQKRLAPLNEATGPIFKIRNDPRKTRVGRILRRTSLDELPQLYNVLRGEMSLVGPRPPLPSEVARYQEWHKKRLEVAPGMTGLWQVSGRSQLSFDEMVLLDIYYIENWSPALDIKILLRTIPKVFLGEGAY